MSERIKQSTEAKNEHVALRGVSVSKGVAKGHAFLYRDLLERSIESYQIGSHEIGKEMGRLESALVNAVEEVSELRGRVHEELGEQHAAMFAAQIQMLRDPAVPKQVERLLQMELINVEEIFMRVVKRLEKQFLRMKDPKMRERSADVADIGRRVLHHLLDLGSHVLSDLKSDSIVVATRLLPSDTANLDRDHVRGLVTDHGGRTSHAAILARELGIPAVSGISNVLKSIDQNVELIVDGTSGIVFRMPSSLILKEYEDVEARVRVDNEELGHLKSLKATTTDGVTVELMANVATLRDAEHAVANGAEGIGLYRIELSYMIHRGLPTVDELEEVLAPVLQTIGDKPVIIRVLDIGGDKTLPDVPLPLEANPYLGKRGLRLLLDNDELFLTQLKTVLKLSARHDVRLLLPMVTNVGDMIRARVFLERAKQDLRSSQIAFNADVPFGAMIELPSAAIATAQIARHADFLSIGTNDLTQYTLAADRDNDEVYSYYNPMHQSVLFLIRHSVQRAIAAGTEIFLCGEIAGDENYTDILVGLGLTHLSMGPFQIPRIKRLIRTLSAADCRKKARSMLHGI